MSFTEDSDFKLNDVYLLAQNIAEEFELVAQRYDIETFRPTVEKVIHALEILEYTVKKLEDRKAELTNAVSNNMHLLSVKNMCYQERAHFNQSLQEAEDLWLKEISTLKAELSFLKTENEQLRCLIAIKQENELTSDERLQDVIKDLELHVCKLQLSLYQKEKCIQDLLSNEISLNDKIKELVEKNKNLYMKNQEHRQNIAQLIAEKNVCKNELIQLKNENELLAENINELVRCSSSRWKDAHESDSESSLKQEIKHHIKLEMKLFDRVKELQSELRHEKNKPEKYEEENLKTGAEENNYLFSDCKVYRFFHLFLGPISLSQYFWYKS